MSGPRFIKHLILPSVAPGALIWLYLTPKGVSSFTDKRTCEGGPPCAKDIGEALSCGSTTVSRCFSSSSFPLRKLHENLVHLLSRNCLESFRPGIPAHVQRKRQKPDGFVIGGMNQ